MRENKIEPQPMEDFLVKNKIRFKNIELYKKAFTHLSYIHEHKKLNNNDSYERMEFLGDSILGKLVSEYLFNEYKWLDQGNLSLLRSRVISKPFLSKLGRKLDFSKYMILGKGENRNSISDSVYEDMFESLIAAIYLDKGENTTLRFLRSNFFPLINEVDVDNLKDFKTKLQECLQSKNNKTVTYELIKKYNSPTGGKIVFRVRCLFDGKIFGYGEGITKKKAEQESAKQALKKLAMVENVS